jgi:hypothetical protein
MNPKVSDRSLLISVHVDEQELVNWETVDTTEFP